MKRPRVPITVSLPSNLAENFEKLAKAESKNKSQLFREMLTAYERRRREERFHELQRYGVKKARKKGILTEADVEKLVFQGR
jgi:metal-responsive CopG/Arc/MetJ family transcriptional regulator